LHCNLPHCAKISEHDYEIQLIAFIQIIGNISNILIIAQKVAKRKGINILAKCAIFNKIAHKEKVKLAVKQWKILANEIGISKLEQEIMSVAFKS